MVASPAAARRPQILSSADIFLRIALLYHDARAGLHIDDEIHLLGTLGRVVEAIPHQVGLPVGDRRQLTGPGAELPFDWYADAFEGRFSQFDIQPNQVAEVLGIAIRVGPRLAVSTELDRLSGEARIFRGDLVRLALRVIGPSNLWSE